MSGFRKDKIWSDKFIPIVKLIVGSHLLNVTSDEVDQNQASDLVTLNSNPTSIACRIRRHGWCLDFPTQFTLRSARDSGSKTELEKIVEGFGDWLFYAHSSITESGFDQWFLISLNNFRHHWTYNREAIKHGAQPNGDGTHFEWFDLNSFPPVPSILIDSKYPLPKHIEVENVNF